MPAPPVMPVPPISPGEMQLLLSRAGLVLNPGQVADLVLAWRQVAGLIASIPHDRPLADDMAYAFHLPPPAGTAVAAPATAATLVQPKAKVAARSKVKGRPKAKAAVPRVRPAAKAKVKAKARRQVQAKPRGKAAPARKAAKPVARKSIRRRR